MKKLLLCAVSLFAATFSNGQFGQRPITLTSDNVQLQSGTIHEHSASTTNVKLPTTGSNVTWNYSGLSGGSAITYGYVKNTNKTFSRNAVLDTNLVGYFDTIGGYPTNKVYDEDSKGLFFAGNLTPRTPTYLGTGYIQDTLAIDNQAVPTTKRSNIIQFPATANSSWSSNFSITTNFTLTLAELGWYNIKCSEVAYTTVKDQIVGYGDLKIPTVKTKNCQNEFDALMDKHSFVTTDSIFIGVTQEDVFGITWSLGYPFTAQQAARYGKKFVDYLIANFGTAADPYGLLPEFGVFEGMTTVADYSEIFYTENAYRPAITFDFGKDNSYSKLKNIVYNMDVTGDGGNNKGCGGQQSDLWHWRGGNPLHNKGCRGVEPKSNGNTGSTALGANGQFISDINSTTQFSVYPNPVVNSSALNCRMMKNSDATWTVNVLNIIGQVVATLPVSANGNLNIPIALNEKIKSGLYIVNVIDEKGQRVGLSKVNVISASN